MVFSSIREDLVQFFVTLLKQFNRNEVESEPGAPWIVWLAASKALEVFPAPVGNSRSSARPSPLVYMPFRIFFSVPVNFMKGNS